MRKWSHALPLAALLLATALTSCSDSDGLSVFDSIVTTKLIRKGCESNVAFSFSTEHTADQRVYRADFELPREHPESFAHVTVTVCKAGVLLDPSEYRKNREEVRRRDAREPEMQLEAWLFPDIGKRAMVGVVLGPGGGGDSLVFTTNDGRFDVRVEQSNHLSEEVEGPTVLCDRIADGICSRYDSIRGG